MTQKKLQFLYNGNSDNNSFINKLEQQDSAPGLEVVAALARALDCSEATLLVGVPDRGPQMSHRDRQMPPTPPGPEETAPEDGRPAHGLMQFLMQFARSAVHSGAVWRSERPANVAKLLGITGVPGGIRTRVSALKGPRRTHDHA